MRLSQIASTVVGASNIVVETTSDVVLGATTSVVSTTKDLFVAAVSHTPGLNVTVKKRIHSGFWEAYKAVRSFVHMVLRRELKMQASCVYFTGHSLGKYGRNKGLCAKWVIFISI